MRYFDNNPPVISGIGHKTAPNCSNSPNCFSSNQQASGRISSNYTVTRKMTITPEVHYCSRQSKGGRRSLVVMEQQDEQQDERLQRQRRPETGDAYVKVRVAAYRRWSYWCLRHGFSAVCGLTDSSVGCMAWCVSRQRQRSNQKQQQWKQKMHDHRRRCIGHETTQRSTVKA